MGEDKLLAWHEKIRGGPSAAVCRSASREGKPLPRERVLKACRCCKVVFTPRRAPSQRMQPAKPRGASLRARFRFDVQRLLPADINKHRACDVDTRLAVTGQC